MSSSRRCWDYETLRAKKIKASSAKVCDSIVAVKGVQYGNTAPTIGLIGTPVLRKFAGGTALYSVTYGTYASGPATVLVTFLSLNGHHQIFLSNTLNDNTPMNFQANQTGTFTASPAPGQNLSNTILPAAASVNLQLFSIGASAFTSETATISGQSTSPKGTITFSGTTGADALIFRPRLIFTYFSE